MGLKKVGHDAKLGVDIEARTISSTRQSKKASPRRL